MAAVTQARSAGLAPTVRPPAASTPFARGGRIELVIGPMFSGKSTELLRRIRRYRFARKECLYVGGGRRAWCRVAVVRWCGRPRAVGDRRPARDCVSHNRLIKYGKDTRYSEVSGTRSLLPHS